MRETKSDQWHRIQSDEAAAVDAQQEAAGGSHSPVRGPGPYGDHGTNRVVDEAVTAERERCAALAESWAAGQAAEGRDLLLRLAAAIRQP